MFVVVACGSAGFRIAASLKEKCALYELLLRQLAMMKQEICFHATPLAQVFALLAAGHWHRYGKKRPSRWTIIRGRRRNTPWLQR